MQAPLLLVLLVALALAAAEGPAQRARGRRPAAAPPPAASNNMGTSAKKPNIVLILTDDQDVELGSLSFMPKTLRAIRDHGAEFRHAYVTTPMCCPSRSSLLTGMYVHNHHVYTNNDNCSSTQWQATHETRSFATYLSNAGYRTGYFGKYLNKYNGSYIPPGWREWGGLIMNSKYYNYSINMNGQKIKHGFDYQKDYYPDLIANDSLAFLRHSKRQYPHKPVMLTMSFPAPHGPEDSAPQYSHLFFNVSTHHTPSYDYAPNPDKQWILQVTQKMAPIHRQFTDLLMTKRLQTLQSVDDAVERVVSELEALGELDNTYVVYTSDHGYHLGQFGLIKGKSFPFEFDVRVPLLARGPGVVPGAVVDELVLNIDLAPTFLEMAGVTPPPHMDGRSAFPLFVNPKRKKLRWPDTFLIESSGRREMPGDPSRAIHRYSLMANMNLTTESPLGTSTKVSTIKQTLPLTPAPPPLASGEDNDGDEDEEEFEDEEEDEEEEVEGGDGTNNAGGGDTGHVSNEEGDMQLDNRLLPVIPNHMSKTERLAIECIREEMKLPCRRGQKWYCENYNGRWRKHKCKLIMPISMQLDRDYRKCACFTPDGLIYKKLPNMTKRDQRLGRIKRDVDLDEILFEKISETKLHKLSKRERRDILSHTNNVMESVQGQINTLQIAKNDSLEDTIDEKPNLETNNIVDDTAGCIIESGRVNCSNIIYQDKKTWLRSRHRIENEIQQLRLKLQTLKEIKRHLKQSRPLLEEEDEDYVRNTTDLNSFNELNLNFDPPPVRPVATFSINRPKNRKRPHMSGEIESSRPKKPRLFEENLENVTFEVEMISKLDESSTTENSLTTHAHRHHHKHQTDTVDASTASPTTEAPRRRIPTTRRPKPGEFIPYPVNQRPLKPKPNFCHCQINEPVDPEARERDAAKEEKRRIKEERLRKKLRKQRKKESMAKDCSLEKMNCFQHDNDHWRTAPLWSAGPFCFCANANNNTYACARTINITHDSLYCEFTTGFKTYYNLRIDPFELQNRFDQLKSEEKSYLHDMLQRLVACRGRSCTIRHHDNPHPVIRSRTNILPIHNIPQQRLKKRKFTPEGRGGEGRPGSIPQFLSADRHASLRDRDRGGNGTRAASGARRRRKTNS